MGVVTSLLLSSASLPLIDSWPSPVPVGLPVRGEPESEAKSASDGVCENVELADPAGDDPDWDSRFATGIDRIG